MIHHGQGLPFRFKARDHRFGVHSELNDLESDTAANRFGLFRDVNDSAAALANLLKQFVAPNRVASFSNDGKAKVGPAPLDRQANPENDSYFRRL
jgi:hypothetical protein